MREVDEANTEARRLAIIEAAMRCFANKGVARTSVNDICREAGMRPSHLYYYFPSKDSVLEAVFTFHLEVTLQRIEHMLDESDLVSAIIDVHDYAEADRRAHGLSPAIRMELECHLARNETLARYFTDARQRLNAAIRRSAEMAMARGTLSKDLDLDTVCDSVALLWNGMAYMRLQSDFDLAAMRRAVALLVRPWAEG